MSFDPTRQSAAADLFTRSASRLATLFYDSLDMLGSFEPVLVDRLPDDFRTLLAHHDQPQNLPVAQVSGLVAEGRVLIQ